MIKRRIILSDKGLLYFLCVLTPIIQIINSAFLFDSSESIFGRVFRIFVVIVAIVIVFRTSRKQTEWILFLTGINIFVAMYNVFCGVSIAESLLNMMKLLSPYVLISAYIGLIEKRKIKIDYFDTLFNYLTVFIPLSIIIPRILGIGYERYEGSGYQGLYYENNALVLIIIITFIYSLENFFINRNFKNFVLVAFTTFSMVINGSKSSMAFWAVITVLYILRYLFVQNPKQFPIRMLVLFFMLGIVAIFLYPMVLPLILRRIEAYSYYYTGGVIVNGGSVIDFLTNGRTAFAEYYFSNYYGTGNILNFIFGIQSLTDIRVEMDFLDIFMYFGIFVSITLVCYYFKAFCNLKSCSFMVKLMFCSTFLYSFLAGHVWNSSLAGLPFSMIFAIVMSEAKLRKNSTNSLYYSKYFNNRS